MRLTSPLFHPDSLSGCPGLVHVMVSESSYGHRVCCVWKTPFPWIHPSPLASVPSFLPRSLSLEVGGVYKDIPFRAEGSKVSCSLHSVQAVVGLWVNSQPPQEAASPMRSLNCYWDRMQKRALISSSPWRPRV